MTGAGETKGGRRGGRAGGSGAGDGTGRAGRAGAGRAGAGGDAEATARPKKKAGGARRTRQKARFNKKSGDIRSLPDAGAAASGTKKRRADAPLTGRAVRYLRGLGHHLDPVVQIGKEGITDAVVAAVKEALRVHELVKIKVGTESPVERKEAGPELAQLTGAHLAQILGRTLLLYKRHPQKPKIELPW